VLIRAFPYGRIHTKGVGHSHKISLLDDGMILQYQKERKIIISDPTWRLEAQGSYLEFSKKPQLPSARLPNSSTPSKAKSPSSSALRKRLLLLHFMPQITSEADLTNDNRNWKHCASASEELLQFTIPFLPRRDFNQGVIATPFARAQGEWHFLMYHVLFH